MITDSGDRDRRSVGEEIRRVVRRRSMQLKSFQSRRLSFQSSFSSLENSGELRNNEIKPEEGMIVDFGERSMRRRSFRLPSLAPLSNRSLSTKESAHQSSFSSLDASSPEEQEETQTVVDNRNKCIRSMAKLEANAKMFNPEKEEMSPVSQAARDARDYQDAAHQIEMWRVQQVCCDDEDFRKLKAELRKGGHVTSTRMKVFLGEKVEDRFKKFSASSA